MSRIVQSLLRPSKKKGLGLLALALLIIPLALAARSDELEANANDLIVHEWGTFLAMNGSDGISLEGMYHEEHALPDFVHARSREQLKLQSVLIKGETPVIYFYTQKPRKVQLDVRFPRGIWTQWYPQAVLVGPQFTQVPRPTDLQNGRIRWYADLIPAGTPGVTVPETSADALWNYARDVDAAYVQTTDFTKEPNTRETDRFLFYRGLGRAPLPVNFSSTHGGTLALDPKSRFGVSHVFVLRVEDGKGVYTYRPSLRPGDRVTDVMPAWDQAKPLDQFTTSLADDLAARLVESGLYKKEARAMVNTWRSSYFQTPGVRVLFILPQAWTDEYIPLKMRPVPAKTVRVMVGRTELLTPEREKLAEAAIRDLASPETTTRQKAFATLKEQGRYVEPIIRRVLASSTDEHVQNLCRQLLGAEFVTELRSAIHHAPTDPRALSEDMVYTRAQLALLLRETGLNAEASTEAKSVLEALRTRTAPEITDPDFRGYSRAYARALEASGNVTDAGAWYDKFVQFGSQALTKQDCRFCHTDVGPRTADWYRSWWAGPKYAEMVSQTEGLNPAIARLSKTPSDPATRLRLVYLLEAQKKTKEANAVWRELERGAGLRGIAATSPAK